MKKRSLPWVTAILFPILFAGSPVHSQVTYTYQLSADFHSQPVSTNDLIQIPNNSGDTGAFMVRTVPATTCGIHGTAHGYFFNDDAGLQFNNPSGFIDKSYSIAFNFQVDEFISPPQWVRILSFTHTDDVGIYIKLTNPPTNGTLEFWPNGTVGTDNFFTTTDFYQMILVRNDAGTIKIYVNGNEFGNYDDSQTQEYVPQAPHNYIIWFRDDPSVLAGEASPGFVQNIIIANYAWTASKVKEIWDGFCSSLLAVEEKPVTTTRIFPNPATTRLNIEMPDILADYGVAVIDVTGKQVSCPEITGTNIREFDISRLSPGVYFVRITSEDKTRVYRLVKR